MSAIRTRHLRERIQSLEDQIARLEAFGEDVYEDGEVLSFEKRHSGRTYTYVALRAGGSWYLSGPRNGYPSLAWNALVDFLAEGVDTVYRVTGWAELD